MTTEFAAVAGIGELYGASRNLTLPMAAPTLLIIVLSGSYRRVERTAILIGALELAFLWRTLEMAATTSTRSATATRRGEPEMPAQRAAPPKAAAEAGLGIMQTMSRMIYSGSYALAYGLVYATVFVVQLLPQDNPVMHGFHDGSKAAMDELSRS
jgi:hypothetical protein